LKFSYLFLNSISFIISVAREKSYILHKFFYQKNIYYVLPSRTRCKIRFLMLCWKIERFTKEKHNFNYVFLLYVVKRSGNFKRRLEKMFIFYRFIRKNTKIS